MAAKSSKFLIDTYPLVIQPTVAKALGLEDAIILQQIQYWLNHNEKEESELPEDKRLHYHDERWWTYNAVTSWQIKNFPFMSIDTIKKAIARLEATGILLSGNYNQMKLDRTKWYSIDYDRMEAYMEAWRKLGSIPRYSNEYNLEAITSSISVNHTNGLESITPTDSSEAHQAIPETNTETSTETTTTKAAHAVVVPTDSPIEKTQDKSQFVETPLNPDFARVAQVWQTEIGILSGITLTKVLMYLTGGEGIRPVPVDWFIEAIEKAAMANVRKPNYIFGTLNNWLVDGKQDAKKPAAQTAPKTGCGHVYDGAKAPAAKGQVCQAGMIRWQEVDAMGNIEPLEAVCPNCQGNWQNA